MIFGCFSHDPGGGLAGVLALTLVLIELNHHIYFRVFLYCLVGMELHIARFTDADGNRCRVPDTRRRVL